MSRKMLAMYTCVCGEGVSFYQETRLGVIDGHLVAYHRGVPVQLIGIKSSTDPKFVAESFLRGINFYFRNVKPFKGCELKWNTP